MRKGKFIAWILIFLSCMAMQGVACSQAPSKVLEEVSGRQPSISMPSLRPDEDWTTPSLSTSHLISTPPIVTQVDDKNKFTREIVSLQWRPFDAIYLYIIKPKGIKNPPLVLYLYGYPTTTKRFLNDQYCGRITERGCAAIGFDTALTGERFRMRPMKEWFVSELPESLATSAHDVQLILDYLATRGDLDMSRVGIFGQGSGATISILAAAADPRIKAIDLLTPWGDWPEWTTNTSSIPQKDKGLYQLPKFLDAAAPLDPLIWLPKLKGREVRLQFNDDDPQVPPASRKKLIEVLPKSGVLIDYTSNLEMYSHVSGGRLFQWMAKELNTQTAPPVASTVTQIKQ